MKYRVRHLGQYNQYSYQNAPARNRPFLFGGVDLCSLLTTGVSHFRQGWPTSVTEMVDSSTRRHSRAVSVSPILNRFLLRYRRVDQGLLSRNLPPTPQGREEDSCISTDRVSRGRVRGRFLYGPFNVLCTKRFYLTFASAVAEPQSPEDRCVCGGICGRKQDEGRNRARCAYTASSPRTVTEFINTKPLNVGVVSSGLCSGVTPSTHSPIKGFVFREPNSNCQQMTNAGHLGT